MWPCLWPGLQASGRNFFLCTVAFLTPGTPPCPVPGAEPMFVDDMNEQRALNWKVCLNLSELTHHSSSLAMVFICLKYSGGLRRTATGSWYLREWFDWVKIMQMTNSPGFSKFLKNSHSILLPHTLSYWTLWSFGAPRYNPEETSCCTSLSRERAVRPDHQSDWAQVARALAKECKFLDTG